MSQQGLVIVPVPPRLTICWLRAVRLVQAQMQRGCELRDEFTAGSLSLTDARAECARWLCEVDNLLERLADTLALNDQFRGVFEGSATNPSGAELPADFTRGVNAALSGLWGVMQRLEFLADPPHQRRSRWLAMHIILESAADRLAHNPYYLPS